VKSVKPLSKKASFQVSVNFLVIMIICIALLGIGISLIKTFVQTGKTYDARLNKYHEEQLRKTREHL
jgi:cytochrome bd-type quinol oxidase subunit 1